MRAEFTGIRITGPEPIEHAVVPARTGKVTALYGMNGAGKSRVLSALDATVRGLRPPRREESQGSLVDPAHPDPPPEVAEVARHAAAAHTVAIHVFELPDDRVDPGEPRPLRFVPAVPASAREALAALDRDDPALDTEAVEGVLRRIDKSASQAPVPLVVPVWPDPVFLTSSEMSILPPVVRLNDDDFVTPTLAVLYGVPTLRDDMDVAHRPLLSIASADEFQLCPAVEASAQELQDWANTVYRRMLQEAPPLRLRIRHPNHWPRQATIRWEAEVSAAPPAELPSPGDVELPGRWLSIDDLSTGQRRWASFAIRVACLLADPADGPYGAAVILDEPEQALHRQAERYCAEGLRALADELGLVVIVATHSPEVLDAHDVVPLHVRRDERATTRVQAFPGWLAADETTLGLARSDLVLRYRTFLLVEGSHDEAALQAWAADDLEQARTSILRLGGARQLPPVVTSQLLFDMTNAHVVVLLDAVDGQAFTDVWDEAVSLWHDGQQGQAEALLESLVAQGSEIEVLAMFCREALKRGHDGRIHPFGLQEPDISNYIAVQEFAPDRPETWDELRTQAQKALHVQGRSFNGRSYKKWLADNRNVRISEASIRQGAARTPRPPEVDELLALCQSTSRLSPARAKSLAGAPR